MCIGVGFLIFPSFIFYFVIFFLSSIEINRFHFMHIFQGISEARELLTATNLGGHVRWNLEIGLPWIGRGLWIPPTTFSVPFFLSF